MTLEPSVHKERVDFPHNYKKIRIKCPECFRTIKGENHVKVYKNLAGLWRHIKLDHGEISNLEFNTLKIKEILKHLAQAIELGMFPDSELNYDTTTSSSILYNGKPPRRDVLDKLRRLAEIMKRQSFMYPIFRRDNIFAYIKIVLGNPDVRIKKQYFECVINNSTPNNENGTYDVTVFCNSL